jgi:hypothetical protein
VITGYDLEAADFTRHGFLRAPDGTITVFDPPGSIRTSPFSINPAGAIAGFYQDPSGGNRPGFLRNRNGAITTCDVPGAGTGSSQGTFANIEGTAGNHRGQYTDGSFVIQGFLRTKH